MCHAFASRPARAIRCVARRAWNGCVTTQIVRASCSRRSAAVSAAFSAVERARASTSTASPATSRRSASAIASASAREPGEVTPPVATIQRLPPARQRERGVDIRSRRMGVDSIAAAVRRARRSAVARLGYAGRRAGASGAFEGCARERDPPDEDHGASEALGHVRDDVPAPRPRPRNPRAPADRPCRACLAPVWWMSKYFCSSVINSSPVTTPLAIIGDTSALLLPPSMMRPRRAKAPS